MKEFELGHAGDIGISKSKIFEMMKRPNKYDFDFSEDYESNLETYCDELEEIVSKGDCITHYEKEIQRLEKTQIE